MLQTVMLVMAVIGVIGLLLGLRQQRGHWNISSTFVFGLAWVVNVAHMLSIFTGGYSLQVRPATGEVTRVLTGGSPRYYGYLIVAFTVAALLLFVIRLAHKQQKLVPAALVALGISAIGSLANSVSDLPVFTISAYCSGAILLATATLPAGRGVWLGVATFSTTLIVVSTAVTAWRPWMGSRDCTADKCGPLKDLIIGVTASENALALAIAVSVPFTFLAFRRWVRWLLIAHSVTMIVLTGSRTSLVVVAVALLMMTLRPMRPSRAVLLSDILAALAVLGAAMTAFWLPRIGEVSSTSFSLRGSLWMIALERMPQSPLVGFGNVAWYGLRDQGLIGAGAIYSPHNQWLDVQYGAGYAGLLLFIVWLTMVLCSGGTRAFRLMAFVVTPGLVVGITERAWSFGNPDWLVWSIVALTLATPQDHSSSVSPVVSAGQEVGMAGHDPFQTRVLGEAVR